MPILGLFRSYRSLSQNRSKRSSPLRHSPLARPVPPLPHAGEANVTYRSCLPRLRDCEAEARPADETAEAEQGQRSVFCKPAATGAAKTGHRNRGPQGRRGPRLRDCAAKTGHRNRGPQGRRGLLPAGTRPPRLRGNRPRTKGPVGPFRLHKAKETLLWLTALY